MKFGNLHVGDVFVWGEKHIALSHLHKKTSKVEYTPVGTTRPMTTHEISEQRVIKVLNFVW